MSFQLLKGSPLAEKIIQGLINEVSILKKAGFIPHMVAIQIGQNKESQIYINQQKKVCEKADIIYEVQEFDDDVSQAQVLHAIEKMNNDKKVTGIILQRPAPRQLDIYTLQQHIVPEKDTEGINSVNLGNLNFAKTNLCPPTPAAVLELLKSCQPDLKGKEITIIGHSNIVGKPLAMLLLQSKTESPTVAVCHVATRDLKVHTRNADILISAAGVPKLIRKDMVKKNAVIIDVGINQVGTGPEKSITGDVDFENVKDMCSYITPVPGGVGPLTVTMLVRNLVECGKRSINQ